MQIKQLYKEKKTDFSIKLPEIKIIQKNKLAQSTQRRTKQELVNSLSNPKYFLPNNKRYQQLSKRIRQIQFKNQSTSLHIDRSIKLPLYKPILMKKNVKLAKDEQLRQSKLFLLKNMEELKKRKKLCFMVQYTEDDKQPLIQNHYRKTQTKLFKPIQKIANKQVACEYQHPQKLQEIDFLKLFILEQLLYYISQIKNYNKQQMLGFCKIYLQNVYKQMYVTIIEILKNRIEIKNTIILQKLSFYVIILISTDTFDTKDLNLSIKSLADILHKNNLIVLDLLTQIAQFENINVVSQFHIFNTVRFNENRRNITYQQNGLELLNKNNMIIMELLKTIVNLCQFASLKNFVDQTIDSKITFQEKYQEIMFVLLSLVGIIEKSLKNQELVQKPSAPFLPPTNRPYTLVLDLDQTLIHFKQNEKSNSFLVRPYCFEFLRQMAKHYEIVIFTASVKQYADTILDILDKEKFISYRLYRQHTRLQDYVSIKDLSLIGRDLAKTIIIDNIPSNFKLQPRNGIYINTWVGDQNDCSLLNLIPILQILVRKNVKDLRDGLETISKQMQNGLQNQVQIDLQDIIFQS